MLNRSRTLSVDRLASRRRPPSEAGLFRRRSFEAFLPGLAEAYRGVFFKPPALNEVESGPVESPTEWKKKTDADDADDDDRRAVSGLDSLSLSSRER